MALTDGPDPSTTGDSPGEAACAAPLSAAPAPGPTPLSALGFDAAALRGAATPDTPVSALTVDSREAGAGTLFFALKGVARDGAEFAPYALRQGCAAVALSPAGAETLRGLWDRQPPFDALPLAVADEPRLALARAASAFYGAQPDTMAAVTGTNGKTSVAAFLRQIWTVLGRRAANFGTTGVEGAVSAPLSHTTPEPITLHRPGITGCQRKTIQDHWSRREEFPCTRTY